MGDAKDSLPTFGAGQATTSRPSDRGGRTAWSRNTTPKPRLEYLKNQVLLDASTLIPELTTADGFSTNGRFHNHTNLLLGPQDHS